MHVLYLSPWFPYPLDTGSRTRVYYLLRGLAHDHDVTLLSLAPQGWEVSDMENVAPLCKYCAIVQGDPFQPSTWQRFTRFLSLRPIVTRPFPEMLDLVRSLHQKDPFDVVIASGTIMSDYALVLTGIPRILEEHNSMSRWMHERYLQQRSILHQLRCWASWRKSDRFERRLFQNFNLVSMVSETDAAYVRRLMPGREADIRVFPNGVDTNLFQTDLVETIPNRLIFSGALDYAANYEAMRFFLSNIFPIIREKLPTAHLFITGSASNVDPRSLQLDNHVTLTGFVDDIRLEIASASVAIAPIVSGGGTRIKILEAMALGTPVVSTTKGAEGLNVADQENILIANKPEEFSKAVIHLLEDPFLRQRLGTNARHLVQQYYTWQSIAQDFSDNVGSVIKQHKSEQA